MLLQLETDVIINTDQIVSITRSNMDSMPAKIKMSNKDIYFHKYQPEALADKIAKLVFLADTYVLTFI